MALVQVTRFWREASLRGAIADFRVVYQQSEPYRFRIAALAGLCTFGIFYVMWQEEARGLPPPPKVTYFNSWRADRSDKEIIASNIANQKRKEREAADEAAHQERIRQMYKTLGRYSGMDVDAIEARENADRQRAGLAPLPGSAASTRP